MSTPGNCMGKNEFWCVFDRHTRDFVLPTLHKNKQSTILLYKDQIKPMPMKLLLDNGIIIVVKVKIVKAERSKYIPKCRVKEPSEEVK